MVCLQTEIYTRLSIIIVGKIVVVYLTISKVSAFLQTNGNVAEIP